MNSFKEIISGKKKTLSVQIEAPMESLAARCLHNWHDTRALDDILAMGLPSLPRCTRLYIADQAGIQLTATISPGTLDDSTRSHDHSNSAVFAGLLPFRGLSLTNAYLSRPNMAPCISALQAIHDDNTLLGFLVADFNLQDLILADADYAYQPGWRQFRGDPSIRGTLFQQQRAFSLMDEYMDETLHIAKVLMQNHGVFHIKLHFSSARATFWHINDPFNYRLHSVEECISPDVCLAYPAMSYPSEAKVDFNDIHAVLHYFKLLRVVDENVYLRSASLNIMNAMVGLTFSCDGSHYMPVKELLQRDLAFWFGASTEASPVATPNYTLDGPAQAS